MSFDSGSAGFHSSNKHDSEISNSSLNDVPTEMTDDQKSQRGDENNPLVENPALKITEKVKFDIEPFPDDVLRRLDVSYAFKPYEKEGVLVAPLTASYHCVWEDVPTTIEEKSEVWAGSEYGSTIWIPSMRLGTYTVSCDGSMLQALQGLQGEDAAQELLERATGTRYSPAKSRTLGRYLASLLSRGDNHITVLTAAYCVLFDRLWWYFVHRWC
jgi:hypothetical protein